VHEHWGPNGIEEATEASWPGAVALASAPKGWVLVDGPAERSLGPALIWGQRSGAHSLRVLVERDEGILARRAGAFSGSVEVFRVEGRMVRAAMADPLPSPETMPAALAPFVDMITGVGADAILEGATLRAEVLGLEVGRVVEDALGPALEVGVGIHDRRAHRLLHPDTAPGDLLSEVVGLVRRHRRPGAPVHPANQLALERWLRAAVVARPWLVGARRLDVFAGSGGSPGVTAPSERRPAAARGVDSDGEPVLAVCSVGVDVDLVPTAVDLAMAAASTVANGASLRLVIAVPEGDDHPATLRLAESLLSPAEVRVVARDWKNVLVEDGNRY
jgi:hypothetical protein